MYTTEYVVRQFSKTPLKHCMSRYLLEKILGDEGLLERIVFVLDRATCPTQCTLRRQAWRGWDSSLSWCCGDGTYFNCERPLGEGEAQEPQDLDV